MAKDGTWGDHVVLFAAANHFQTSIRIISHLDREIVVQPDHALADTNPLVLGHIHELHYVSLHPRQGKTFFPITNILVFFGTCGNYVCRIYMHTAILRKVVRKNVHATIPKGNMGYEQYNVPDNVAVEPTFVDFLYHSQTYVLSFFQISLKNSELKTTHNTFWGSRTFFIRQPSSKQLFIRSRRHCKMMLILQMSL